MLAAAPDRPRHRLTRPTRPRASRPASSSFIGAPDDVKHADFVTEAWVKDPLKVLLRRIDGFSRAAAPVPAGSVQKKK